MRSTLPGILAALVIAGAAGAQHEPQAHSSPYAGQETSGIAALSRQEMEDLLAGSGMGLARAAELNHYPGPLHVLELAAELDLTAEQRAVVAEIHERMRAGARRLGAEIVERERVLDRRFAHGHIAEGDLRELTAEIGRLRGELRFTHLAAHLETKAALTAAQVAAYDRSRGYGAAAD